MDAHTLEAMRRWTQAVPTVSAFVASLVRDFQDRDDILQEIAVAVLESFERYDPTQSFVGWVLGIARNQVRLHYRRQGREKVVFDSETVEALARAFAEGLPADPRLDRLGECFERLDARSRELCRLRYECDLKPAAIGAHLDLGANTVAKALQRIRDRLRECIEGHPGAAEIEP